MLRNSAIFLVAAIAVYRIYYWHASKSGNQAFRGSEQLLLNYPSTKWGSLRSGHYLGLRTMSPDSLLTGMMWFRQTIEQNTIPLRHWCAQGDSLKSYTWLKHDFDNFGIQEIFDKDVNITTKVVFKEGDGWTSSVSFVGKPDSKIPVSFLWYFVTQGPDDRLILHKDDEGYRVSGNIRNIGQFAAYIGVVNSVKIIDFSSFTAVGQAPVAKLKEVLLSNMFSVPNDHAPSGRVIGFNEEYSGLGKGANLIAVQITGFAPFEVNVAFASEPSSLETNFDKDFEAREKHFDSQFEQTFGLEKKTFNSSQIAFAKAALSNMIGSIGYFYGSSLIQSEYDKEPQRYGPFSLLTAVPSRPFFPRGFLWDEGFHNLLISKVRPDLTISIVRSWLNLINSEGWIPREVIFGEEAEARVPAEFIVQRTTSANPPTLFLTLESLLDSGNLNDTTITEIYERLELWVEWFTRTQTGSLPGSYRWRGRDAKTNLELNPKTLTSGLDDYPRATHPTTEERHVDLRCWMALANRVMAKLAKRINHPSFQRYQSTAAYLSRNDLLDELHWFEGDGMYADYGLHSLNVTLVKVKVKVKPKNGQPEHYELRTQRKVREKPQLRFVPDFGYVSLFPFMLNIIDPHNPKLAKVLEDLKDPNLLWTPYGLRSVSKQSAYYNKYNTEHDGPYWRGPIWINMNFLVLRALRTYSNLAGPSQNAAKSLYKSLRANLVENMYRQYVTSGFIWEQYNDRTGKGQASHPFTGWSALITLIMSENF